MEDLMNIVVLGGGLVGGPMAHDLASDTGIKVTVADINPAVLEKFSSTPQIDTIQADLSDQNALLSMLADFDMVISAVPGFMGFKTLETIIKARKNVIDIAFFPEDALELDELAKENRVTAIVDCGVAPGMSNLLTGYASHLLDKAEKVRIYVGGLPVIRQQPWEYKAVFSPIDVIEEYLRPSFFVKNKKIVSRPALSDPEFIDFPELGTLEAFNTDGLRSLIKTMDIPDMKEKTLRYPGHIEKIRFLRDTGFFSDKEIQIGSQSIRPIDMTARILFPQWELKEGDEDVTIMKIQVDGIADNVRTTYTWDLFDTYDKDTRTHSMARTTGYTATVAARMLKNGLFSEKGIIPPELIGRHPDCVAFILEELKKRRVVYRQQITRH